METKDKKNLCIKKISNKASYLFEVMRNCLDYLQQFDRNSRESCLAGQYLWSICLDSLEQQLRSLLMQRSFQHAGILLKVLESLHTILEENWRHICNHFYWRNKWWFHIHPQMIKCKLREYPRPSFQNLIESK